MRKRPIHIRFAVWCASLLLAGCANRGIGPQGGPKDTTPPVVESTRPAQRATEVPCIGATVVLETNENISIKDPTKVVISPPQKNRAGIKGTGRRVTVSLTDTLKENTTYTIQFGDNIVDYNEGNPLKNYEFTFSTGDRIDSLRVSGTVLNSRTLAPMEGLEVGLHSQLADSAFFNESFDYIGMTDAKGRFTIAGVREGEYRLYALNNAAGTHRYTQTGTDIAFYDSIIRPEIHVHATIDTLWSDSTHTVWDNLDVQTFEQYLPNDLLLLSFNERHEQQFFRKGYRPTREQLNLVFNTDLQEEPEIRLLDQPERQDWLWRGWSDRKDSCIYWMKDTLLTAMDTLRLTVSYASLTENGADTLRTDTLSLNYRPPLAKKKGGDAGKDGWVIQHNLASALGINDSIRLTLSEPIAQINDTLIHLLIKQDTLWNPVPFTWVTNLDSCPTQVSIQFDREWEASYRLTVDSLAFTSWFGRQSMPLNKSFQVKKPEDYANLYVKITASFTDGMVELMNDKEVVLRTEPMGDEAAFENLAPGTYMLRLYRDLNGNAEWDSGEILEHRQPEPVYYYPKKLQLRANWDNEESWEPETIDWESQRPDSGGTGSAENKKRLK
ncbi:MAG: Ig-like domain-containing protein [Paludibacteraceae bacterium]|nr:Ig-like domain-containing protein [Paludibacteraceae bacterium]